MSGATLREQLQMARINRAKRRVAQWWHRERCEACAMQRVAGADMATAVTALVRRVHDELGEGFALPPQAGEPPKH